MIYIGRLGIKKEFEIRTRYEYGENLKDLAIIYKVPLRTLEERKAKSSRKGDPWIKGFRATEGYKEFVEDNEAKKEALNKEITARARKETIQLEQMIDEFYEDTNALLIPEVEKAFVTRSSRILKQLKMRRLIEGIYTPEQQLAIELLKVQLETKKTEAKLKVNELKSKNIDLAFKKEKASAFDIEVKDEENMS
ncbi:hypothetical protein [Cetobacterium sp.]|uniref:hypothetical protein n=1 Tax=Cetobacterium sp. TaxID=2071632 RepID=UPI003F3686F7